MTGTDDFGIQPLDEIMKRLGLSNHALVSVSTQQLSHKVIQKGRKGKRLTLRAQQKILTALKLAVPDQRFTLKDLFQY